MQLLQRDSVRALLPIVALAFCQSSGGSHAEPVVASNSTRSSSSVIAAANRAPTITTAGAQVARVGATFEFQPNSQDADGDRLTYSAENLPPWARLDTATGRIVGTPATADVGEYEGVTITVADATHHAVSSPFNITVVGPTTGVATLEWRQPVSQVDGEPLEDLAGYRIVYGRNPEDMDQSVFISDPGQHSYEFATLSSGVWYFAVIAVNANGLEGPPTAVATKSI